MKCCLLSTMHLFSNSQRLQLAALDLHKMTPTRSADSPIGSTNRNQCLFWTFKVVFVCFQERTWRRKRDMLRVPGEVGGRRWKGLLSRYTVYMYRIIKNTNKECSISNKECFHCCALEFQVYESWYRYKPRVSCGSNFWVIGSKIRVWVGIILQSRKKLLSGSCIG